MMDFSSDTSAPVHPAVLAAVAQANVGTASSYGADAWTERAQAALCEAFETDLAVWLVSSGTAANALGLSTLCPPIGSVVCHEEAHIERDERGAFEFYTGGGRISLLPGINGKILPATLDARLATNRPEFVHETPLSVLSISNLTESGTAYTVDETSELAARAKAAGLTTHLDGARFANAVASLGASPADLSWRAGVDVMSFGATKNGGLGCEAILLFGDMRARLPELQARAKRAGHMPPKMRYMAAQMEACLHEGLWLELAHKANGATQELATVLQKFGGELVHPVDGNELFVRLPTEVATKLEREGAQFYPWPGGAFRFVCSWATSAEEIAQVARVLGR